MYYMSHPLSVRLNDATIARLGRHAQRAHLAPRTLALMHGSTYVGDTVAALNDLARAYDKRLRAAMAEMPA